MMIAHCMHDIAYIGRIAHMHGIHIILEITKLYRGSHFKHDELFVTTTLNCVMYTPFFYY